MNAISEINNTLEGKSNRLDETKHQISDLKNKVEKNTQAEQQKEKNNLKKLGELQKHFGQQENITTST